MSSPGSEAATVTSVISSASAACMNVIVIVFSPGMARVDGDHRLRFAELNRSSNGSCPGSISVPYGGMVALRSLHLQLGPRGLGVDEHRRDRDDRDHDPELHAGGCRKRRRSSTDEIPALSLGTA